MPRVLIIACGNPLRCDDGVAWRAADELSRSVPAGVEIVAQHQLTPELAFPISQAGSVLFVDAAHTGMPGEVKYDPVQPRELSSSLSHEFSPAAILDLAQRLYGRCPPAFIISICGERFEHGERLSSSVEEGLPHLVERIRGFIADKRLPAAL